VDRVEFSRTSAYIVGTVLTDNSERESFRQAAIAAHEDLTLLPPDYQELMLQYEGRWQRGPRVTTTHVEVGRLDIGR
jgi:hypothetical protein